MPTQINGLPAHVLLIHVIVVLTPIGALLTVLSALWPTARRRIGIVGPVVCALVVVCTPITQNAGEWLEHRLERAGDNRAIERHARLGDTFLWYALALFVVSVGVWLFWRRVDALTHGTDGPADVPDHDGVSSGGIIMLARPAATATPVSTSVTVLAFVQAFAAVVVSALVVYQVYRVGDSGAHAAWDYVHRLR